MSKSDKHLLFLLLCPTEKKVMHVLIYMKSFLGELFLQSSFIDFLFAPDELEYPLCHCHKLYHWSLKIK